MPKLNFYVYDRRPGVPEDDQMTIQKIIHDAEGHCTIGRSYNFYMFFLRVLGHVRRHFEAKYSNARIEIRLTDGLLLSNDRATLSQLGFFDDDSTEINVFVYSR